MLALELIVYVAAYIGTNPPGCSVAFMRDYTINIPYPRKLKPLSNCNRNELGIVKTSASVTNIKYYLCSTITIVLPL